MFFLNRLTINKVRVSNSTKNVASVKCSSDRYSLDPLIVNAQIYDLINKRDRYTLTQTLNRSTQHDILMTSDLRSPSEGMRSFSLLG